MTQLPILLPAANLTKSPSNVRKVSDAVADAQLEANIAAKGVRKNLIGVPVPRKKGHYRIIAGGRRLDAVHRLIEKGTFDPAYQVAVLVLGDANDAIETSLEENILTLAMNPADECRAFQDIIEIEGKTSEDVAKRFGLTERFVRSRLRLADLAEPIFDALRNGEITLNIAIAYASNSDRIKQAAVFELLKDGPYRANVNEIKRQLAENTYVGNDPKALLVGRDAYIEAGGRIDPDLFTDSTTERWIDGDLLDRLAADKLAAAAEAMRERDGYAEVRVLPTTHVSYKDTWDLRPLKGETPLLTAEQQSRLDEIKSELEVANEAYEEGGDDGTAALANRIEMLEAECRSIEKPAPILTDEQKTGALAYVVIGHDGQPRLHEQLYIAPVEEPPAARMTFDGLVEEVVETAASPQDKPIYSQRVALELAEMKSEVLRVHIASDPRFALDLGTFWMVDKAMRADDAADLATQVSASQPATALADFRSGTIAAEEWAKIEAGLDRSWIGTGDAIERYDAFCALDDESRAAWLAWAIARTLHAVVAGASGDALINHLGTSFDIDEAAWWRPTANNYFDRLSGKSAILAHIEMVGGKELATRYGASKKHDLSTSAEKIFAGDVPLEAEVREAAMRWVPDAMRFQRPAIEVESGSVSDAELPGDDGAMPQAA